MAALAQVFAADLGQSPEANDSKPFDSFLAGALRVFPTLVDRYAERADGLTLRSEPYFWRPAQEPDKNDFSRFETRCVLPLFSSFDLMFIISIPVFMACYIESRRNRR